MIRVQLSGLIVAVMMIGVLLVCSLWIWNLWRERRREVHRRRIAGLAQRPARGWHVSRHRMGDRRDAAADGQGSCRGGIQQPQSLAAGGHHREITGDAQRSFQVEAGRLAGAALCCPWP